MCAAAPAQKREVRGLYGSRSGSTLALADGSSEWQPQFLARSEPPYIAIDPYVPLSRPQCAAKMPCLKYGMGARQPHTSCFGFQCNENAR